MTKLTKNTTIRFEVTPSRSRFDHPEGGQRPQSFKLVVQWFPLHLFNTFVFPIVPHRITTHTCTNAHPLIVISHLYKYNQCAYQYFA
jgi:hypothetical protein